MNSEKRKALLNIAPCTHLRLTPIPKLPNMDRDVVVNCIRNWSGEPSIVYGMSERCDGYAIPFSWIEDYEIIE